MHSDGLHDLYLSQTIIRVMKSRIMSWTGSVARMEERKGASMVFVGKSDGKDHLRDLGLGGRN